MGWSKLPVDDNVIESMHKSACHHRAKHDLGY